MVWPEHEFWQNIISDRDLRDMTLSSTVQKLLIIHDFLARCQKLVGPYPTNFFG